MVRSFGVSFFGFFLAACISYGGSEATAAAISEENTTTSLPVDISSPTNASPIAQVQTPSFLYEAIAKATLPSSANGTMRASRTTEIKQWIASNGGDAIYQNYFNEYAPPSDQRKWYLAQTGDQSSSTLGYYYLTHPLTNGPDVVLYDCTMTTSFYSTDPTIQGLCGLSQWDAYELTGNVSYAHDLVSTADGFIAQSVDGQMEWHTPLVPAYGITKAPWISALSQSVAVSVLLRAYQYTGDHKYMDAATAAFRWMTVPVSQGGVVSNDIGTWLEEYPNQNPDGINGSVFNGNIWALFGVWDYYRVTGDSQALTLFNATIRTIKNNIEWYDLGYWNVYSHQDRISPVNGLYMQFIAQQMLAMYAITGDPFFQSLGAKWANDQATDTLFVHNMAQAFIRANPAPATTRRKSPSHKRS